ncbi:Ribonuclease P protein subunit p30 [Ananas comosus]|uniref:Ribonuclease P protein subunit p30 n=1 Tax=Ananas comosus TaxID=4615 RepID=A0A199VX21_ANACO|nr:Ribonuclease P protein subunit p30 [Ananas comosus]
MALFFDLSVPYLEREHGASSSTGAAAENKALRSARLRAAVKALELGYAGVAYDRPFRGVVADSDRSRSAAPFPLPSLLAAAPSLAAAAALHRRLLRSPPSPPFRQFSRITLSLDSPAAVASSSSNPVLRTYDIVAIRPLNQAAFDHACKFSEVDMISIDFSQKLPFRLKLPLVEVAIKRGLHFEITYSHLIADVNVRRQMLADAKLLVEWTRGKNVIISSAASSVNDIRGPYDVTNLVVFLLGLSMERAKAAISTNCRSLLVKALRKKHFYKETIRIERILPDNEQFDSKKFLLSNLINWDPISSGEGDLPSLDDIANSTPSKKQNASSKAIDFTSITDGTPFLLSHNATIISSSNNLSACAVPDEVSQQDEANEVLIENSLSTSVTALEEQISPPETILVPLDNIEKLPVEAILASEADALQSDHMELEDCNTTVGDTVLLSSDANLSSFTVTENTQTYNGFLEDDEGSKHCETEAHKDVTELMKCIASASGNQDQTQLNDDNYYSNSMKDDMHTEGVKVRTAEREASPEEVASAHDEEWQNFTTEPALTGQREGLDAFLEEMHAMDVIKDTNVVEREDIPSGNTVSLEKILIKEEERMPSRCSATIGAKSFEVKSGSRFCSN